MSKNETKESCTCYICKSACEHKPGWFVPGEVEKVADYLDITLKKLFDTKLMVDWWSNYPEDIFLLSPAIVNRDVGQEFPANPKGRCVFYKKGSCEIHSVKPFECKDSLHNDTFSNRHENVANKWKTNQQQIEDLSGRKPISEEYYGF